MPDTHTQNVATPRSLEDEIIHYAGLIWRTYETAITGRSPPPGLWKVRLLEWKSEQNPSARNPLVGTAISAASRVVASIKTAQQMGIG